MAQDNKSNLPPIEDLGHPDFIQSIVSMAMDGKPPDPTKVERLGPILQELARQYRETIETEKGGTGVANELKRIERIRDLSARLNAELLKADDDHSMEWLWRADSEMKRRREAKRPRYPRRQCADDPRGRKQSQTNGRLPPGVPHMGDVRTRVSELVTIAAFAAGMIGATPGAKGGPVVAANVADVRLGAAAEIGCIFRWLTGERPKRKVLTVEREGVTGGQQYIETGSWRDFLTPIMEKIFGDTKGLDRFAHEVVHGMDKNPDQYWTSLIHMKD